MRSLRQPLNHMTRFARLGVPGPSANKPFFLCHHFKAPHDYFDHAERYQDYLADVTIPEPPTLYDVPDTFGSLATRGYEDELLPHIGSSIGRRNPRRSYAVEMFKRFPEEFPADYDPAQLSEREPPGSLTRLT